MPTACSVCGTPIDVHQEVRGGVCDTFVCRATAAKRWEAQRRDRRKAIAQAHLSGLLGPQHSPETVQLVLLSAAPGGLQPTVATRRENLRSSLAASLADSDHVAEQPRGPPAAPVRPSPQALSAACATCRGFCCREGGDHAFLDAGTLQRLRVQQPALTPHDCLELYLAALPERSVVGSCVYHGVQGCALPRELRSDICNDYFCEPLREWIHGPCAARPAAVVVMEEEQVMRSVIIET